jgi:hypothetical protein
MVNRYSNEELGTRRFILVWVHTLLQCSADRSIALRVLQQVCLCVYKKGGPPFYNSRVGPYMVTCSLLGMRLVRSYHLVVERLVSRRS